MSKAQATRQAAQLGGLQGHSIAAPYPYVVVSIDNPTDMPKGLYWYVVDIRKGSTDLHDRVGIGMKGKLASLYAHCNANALYARNILQESLADVQSTTTRTGRSTTRLPPNP